MWCASRAKFATAATPQLQALLSIPRHLKLAGGSSMIIVCNGAGQGVRRLLGVPDAIGRRLRASRLACRALLCAVALAAAFPAPAQQAPASESPAPVLQEVVVTGSRIAVPNEVSTSPIQVISYESLRVTGRTDITDVINQLPQNFVNDLGQDLGNGTPGL